jgi:hypothetical protein
MKNRFLFLVTAFSVFFYTQSLAYPAKTLNNMKNPYYSTGGGVILDWTNIERAVFHTHDNAAYNHCTHGPDVGSMSLANLKTAYNTANITILAVSQGSKCKSCDDATDLTPPAGSNMICLPGTEIKNNSYDHIVNLFGFIHVGGTQTDFPKVCDSMQNKAGSYFYFAHPGRYWYPGAGSKYRGCSGTNGWTNLINTHSKCIGMEIWDAYGISWHCKTKSGENFTYYWMGENQWDTVLSSIPYSRNCWGFAGDDNRDAGCVSCPDQSFKNLGQVFNIFPIAHNRVSSYLYAHVYNGAFLIACNGDCTANDAPVPNNITVNTSTGIISIQWDNYNPSGGDYVAWVTQMGQILPNTSLVENVKTDPDVNGVNDNIGKKYVRAYLCKGTGGLTATQPFQLSWQ